MSAFGGFPPELFLFFEGLRNDNSKAYWSANRTVWAEQVRTPMLALLEAARSLASRVVPSHR